MDAGVKLALKEALLWGTLALGGAAGVYFFDDLRDLTQNLAQNLAQTTSAGQPVASVASSQARGGGKQEETGSNREVRLTADYNGHFLSTAEINGRPAKFMIDTGATMVVLTFDDATQLGLSPRSLDFSSKVQTANGTSRVAEVTLDRVRLDDISIRDVPALVAERGALGINLLGMSFLRRLSRFEMKGRELVLMQ